LLRDTKMHLKQNRFYGLLGPNQCGKTTLMRAIVGEKLEGFPKRDELKTIFVEHEIEDEEVDVQDDGFPILSVDKPGWWWVMHTCNVTYQMEMKVTGERNHEGNWFRVPWRARSGGQPRLSSDHVLWRVENENAALCGETHGG